MPTNVPAPTFGTNGFVAPSGPSILDGVQADINASFGSTLSFALNTPQGQLAMSLAAIIANNDAIFVYYTQQVDPAYATGRMQDAIARIYGLERNPAEPTQLQVICSGLPGVAIPLDATIVDTSDNLYKCTEAGTIGLAGTVTLPFACTEDGPNTVPAAGSISIYQAIPGWDSVTVASGVEGVAAETRSAFETRRQESVAGNSFGAIGAIIGAVAQVPGVIDYAGFDNTTTGTVVVKGVSIAAKSILIAVAGGDDEEIANAILSKKSPGCGMSGDTTVSAFDDNPLYSEPIEYEITFQRTSDLGIVFTIVIVDGPGVPSDAADQIQEAILDAFVGGDDGPKARIGSQLYATRYIPPIAALGAWAQISSLSIGSANDSDAVFVGRISGTTLTVTAMTSGTIAVNQAIFDPLGRIEPGTQIVSQLTGTPGGVGTYSVSITQTVAGATFTGTGAGTNLTVSAVTGTIGIGDVISGTGVPGGTTIVSQTSGTPGGAGVYVTSGVTTSSGAAITANSPIDAVAGSDSLVAVQLDQLPSLVAANIKVSVA